MYKKAKYRTFLAVFIINKQKMKELKYLLIREWIHAIWSCNGILHNCKKYNFIDESLRHKNE